MKFFLSLPKYARKYIKVNLSDLGSLSLMVKFTGANLGATTSIIKYKNKLYPSMQI